MKNYKTPLLIASIMMAFGIAGIIYGCTKIKWQGKQPVKVGYFQDGQILLPDYACPDTLIVVDAESLNKNMAYYEQNINWGSDADIDSLLHCPNKQGLLACMTFEQYVNFLDVEGYRYDIAVHIAKVDFCRLAYDDLYQSIKED